MYDKLDIQELIYRIQGAVPVFPANGALARIEAFHSFNQQRQIRYEGRGMENSVKVRRLFPGKT